MNHYTWTYVAGGGRNYNVGLFHGGKTGHVMIYVGGKIIVVDFKVLDTKEYTFFIEDELCHIKLERRGEEMYYFFNIDRKADTPRNRARNAMERKFLRQMLFTFAIFAALIAAFVAWGRWVKRDPVADLEHQLQTIGTTVDGRILLTEQAPGEPHIFYQFLAGGEGLTVPVLLQSEDLLRLTTYMPLENGDEFMVRYLPGQPAVNQLYLTQPSPRQVGLYRERVAAKMGRLHPELSKARIDCLVEAAYGHKGVKSLADFYYQDTPVDGNPLNNQSTYLRLQDDSLFKLKIRAACGND